MYKKEHMYYSPSDLTKYMESPFASWMDRFAQEYPELVPKQDPNDDLMVMLQQKGYQHEDKLEAMFIAEGKNLIKIEGENNDERYAKTLQAMQSGVEIIVQARLELDQFAGFADFLVKVNHEPEHLPSSFGNWHYEVWDTKLASRVKPTFIIQLCCYAQMLESIQGCLPQYITVALGNGEVQVLRTYDFYYYYLKLKDTFLKEHAEFHINHCPNPADSESWGNWSNHAEQILLSKDHLCQVASITKGQIKKLNKVGIHTMQQLADSSIFSVGGMHSTIFTKLKAQASIQIKSKLKSQRPEVMIDSARPEFEIIKPAQGEKKGLTLLPPDSPMDVFFDIEGFPLDEGGLEYLWGNSYLDEHGNRQFKDFWAHNREQEKQCFQDFIHWAYDRWQQDPSMHIYHYASYEVTACRKLMGRYGICEFEVDQLLRNEVFVDLYKVVKGGLRLGAPRYSIKNVELLYRNKRNTQVGNGSDSIIVYDQWRALYQRGEEGDTWQTSKILSDIRDYNIDDCDSTQELAVWLREQQTIHNIDYLGKAEVIEPEISEEATMVTALRDRLLAQAQTELLVDSKQAQLTENLAWMLDFHRREAKPLFWRLFDRLGSEEVMLMDDLDCLALCERTQREPFKSSPKARNLSYEYRFDINQEFKGAANNFYVLGVETSEDKNVTVGLVKEDSDLGNGVIVLKAKHEPPSMVSLIPDELISSKVIAEAVFKTVVEYEQGLFRQKKSAIMDFLTGVKPRLLNHKGGDIVSSEEPDTRLKQVIIAISNLDSSYLPIQGPPGSGKTYTGKHAIAHLLKSGAKIGISSNSHKAINNLLLSTAKHCKQNNIKASSFCTKETDDELSDYDVTIISNNQLANHIQPACVVGTTAWGFAREDMADQLDYLFVDEAGQVSTANLVAMSRSARNLVLMGDQMQLGQPSQGTHPAKSGLSILDYLLHDTPTISADMGVFLDMTYRMHSKVNTVISQLIYESKLRSHLDNDKRILKVLEPTANHSIVPQTLDMHINTEAGIIFVPVEHEGNTQASDEEVAMIEQLAKSLLGCMLHTGLTKDNGEAVVRPITWDDMLFVAPYNHQVSKLKNVLGKQAKVGSVDKFQGQESPIVFLSMCASDANESPRGMDFLFDKNRINVAISRAQTLAIVVANPNLGNTSVNSVEQLRKVNLFNAVMYMSSDTNATYTEQAIFLH
ncbi:MULTISPECIES: TM0106 family RecB-like putative nuclease [Psychrobacter]|uniref:RNA helicase n=1 Tax=Psychrobacter alimentarius TaxID=261164 RepID=A0ABM5ZYP1_9GAMM|nr:MULTISPECIES: TM0106 family RecB-like putative nuclease [Psychrobacter]AMT97243.1 Putative RNA helicase [Psychrobacter alimentarius]QCB30432.1 TM0106 family RecB-like putative nuclease [Psychrobacter sp. PAMC27889]